MILTKIIDIISEINRLSIVLGFLSIMFITLGKVYNTRGHIREIGGFGQGIIKKKNPDVFKKTISAYYTTALIILVFSILIELYYVYIK